MQKIKAACDAIENGRTAVGIELGSTRIKAVLTDADSTVLATGSCEWENHLEDGCWSYTLDEVWAGLQKTWRALAQQVLQQYGLPLRTVGVLGISGMMHGYLPFDARGNQLAAFRTWRNTTTKPAADELTRLLHYNIPQRWSVAHLYQAVLNGEAHVSKIAFLTTLAGYVHWQLTGCRVLGVGDASGMFPVDENTRDYDAKRLETAEKLLREKGVTLSLHEVFPKVLYAGEKAGTLTEQGAALLDPQGTLQAGIPLCPPEGDAGTGMVATHSIAPGTGNVSAGTSIFAMSVLEKSLDGVYPEIDLVQTPDGAPVAMVHGNTCTSELDAWVGLFGEVLEAFGTQISKDKLYGTLYGKALETEDTAGLLAFNCHAGEPVLGLEDGTPLFARMSSSSLNLPAFMRVQLYSALAVLRKGLDLLWEKEKVRPYKLLGHGGLFKTPEVGQRLMAGALGIPVAVMQTAGEGGPWGMALLAGFGLWRKENETLNDYLTQTVFEKMPSTCLQPKLKDQQDFDDFMRRYEAGLAVQQAAAAWKENELCWKN